MRKFTSIQKNNEVITYLLTYTSHCLGLKSFLHNKIYFLSLLFGFLLVSCSTSRLSQSGQRKTAGKTFVIVGASSGFGRGVAERLGEYKANVVLAARRTDLLEEVAAKVRTNGGTALVVTMDISKPEDVQRLKDSALKQFGDIDVWINMAGVGAIGRFWEIPIEEQAQIVDINLKGFIYGSHAAINQFTKQGYGVLINMGSIESENPLAYHASYAATKGGVLNLGEAINQELRLNGHKNIKVVTVEPWAFDTPFWRHAANYSGGTPRMAAMDNPDKVVNAVIWSSLHPRKELAVATKAKLTRFSHHLFPHTTERMSANIVHKYQIKTAPPTPPTSGSVFKPMESGRGVDDGVRARMKVEKKQLKMQKKQK
ncbi:SDR family NAD(P)-dependent oxidoreductase [Segetibacter aerophilus]|uniref:SDR family NAD(P)-dependent oxidoreductase n=1 Tax=Segetibacter aerophilus TaxID=670293 RepID=UPI0011BDD566|nr:SDR family NAD(P)-dependent oxidoreductase [Segetibacter aerophilus]